MESGNMKDQSFLHIGWQWMKGFPGKPLSQMEKFMAKANEIGVEDPRKVIHSMKVGLTITLVSLFYYFRPLYAEDFEVLSSMSTLMTVVAVFEFSVGATIGKILNSGLGTLVACGLGLAARHLAHFAGRTYESIILGTLVFIQAAATTYVRFFPKVKARYDHGATVFMLTFCLVSVSGFEMDEMVKWLQDRIVSVLLGATICVMVSIIVFPVWAGEELHRLVARNMENLGSFMEDLEAKCFTASKEGDSRNGESFFVGLNHVIDSKTNLENLVNFARWEPSHGQFRYFHPWKLYLKIGKLTSQCACRVELLNAYLNSTTQTPGDVTLPGAATSKCPHSRVFNFRDSHKAPQELRATFQEASSLLSLECGKALKELAWSIDTMIKLPSPSRHVTNLTIASDNIKNLLNSDSWEGWADSSQTILLVGVASLLTDIAFCVKTIDEAVNKLGLLATFAGKELNGNSPMKDRECLKHDHEILNHVVTVNEESVN
ncbi:aluminum-activated malate transporter 2-like [Dorcoceras hygrometricum]|uniref:Aluminum-activated malate transporter 2-like n=1 Tax=Dorcoceras hygrometricum TaxID=472368 RepID=A0A2Z7DED8_9LAMI|nr:aluminum-activated malate transporter 2-like [Dorcoceras hygrometricum]